MPPQPMNASLTCFAMVKPFDDQRVVLAAKAKAVGQGHLDAHRPGLIGDVVKVAFGVGVLQVDSRRRRLVADGCAVTAIDRDGAALDRLAEETGARPLLLDLTDQRAIAGALADAPAFAVVVNNAGIDQHAFFTDTTPEDWRRLLAINLEAVFAITHVTLPAMRAAGAGAAGGVAPVQT